jgi:hypothetical protein
MQIFKKNPSGLQAIAGAAPLSGRHGHIISSGTAALPGDR